MSDEPKMQYCFNCGEELGPDTGWSHPLDHCGKPECAREARNAMETERSEAHEQLDRDGGW